MNSRIVEAIPIREQVADIIRKMIVNGELKADQQISEREISQMLMVSTTPVKEAFRVLESEGLLYSIPRKGSYISKLSRKNILQTVFMRGALEGVAAFFAARNATYNEIMIMEEALNCAGELVDKAQLTSEIAVRLTENNNLFHSTLRSASKNTYLVGLIDNMRSIDQSIRSAAVTSTIDERIRAQKEHLAILKAVKEQNSEKAEQLINAHVRRVGIFVLAMEDEEL
ncbi:GntR family transcriptional regulator [Clostridiaceae bacterium Marseille-Q4143]|nr:GntR family transcriptional regulator [Clostridiaceae bacterium Marseille-Q4143]